MSKNVLFIATEKNNPVLKTGLFYGDKIKRGPILLTDEKLIRSISIANPFG